MVSAIWINQFCNPELLILEVQHQQPPSKDEVWLEQEAIGVNFLDVLQRKARWPLLCHRELG